jgi:4-oxalocrotonate tautomerase
MDVLHYREESVSLAMEQVAARDWTTIVYDPDIRARPDMLYKRPGYEP